MGFLLIKKLYIIIKPKRYGCYSRQFLSVQTPILELDKYEINSYTQLIIFFLIH